MESNDTKENENVINEEKPKENWYKKREDHWASQEPTIKSVLGGFENSHLPDVKCSCELLNGLILSKQLTPGNALDCGAGIGRVTEYVLSNFFKEIDLVEKDKKFIEKCKVKFSGNNKIKNIYSSPLESFKFEKKYDLIWIQWCLENLEEKENDKGEKEEEVNEFTYSDLDFSKQRPDAFYINFFLKNKFKIKLHFLNPNWPEDMMPLCIYVLSKE